MSGERTIDQAAAHDHVFLAPDHDKAERRTWAVISLCGIMMALEIAGGLVFGSIALVADGFKPVVVGGFFDKAELDLAFVAEEEARVTRGYLRLINLSDLELPIIEYPLPEVIARWQEVPAAEAAAAHRG